MPAKKSHMISREIPEESIEMNSPSKQSKDIYHDQSLTPSTPTGCAYESEGLVNETTTQKKLV